TSVTPYAPASGTNPASGLEGTWELPSVIQGNPLKSQPRNHSQALNAAADMSRIDAGLRAASRRASHPASAGKSARYRQKRNVASAASTAGIEPKSCMLTYTHE